MSSAKSDVLELASSSQPQKSNLFQHLLPLLLMYVVSELWCYKSELVVKYVVGCHGAACQCMMYYFI